MKKILLHICCGVCAAWCIERLKKEDFIVEGFFFNPNIHPHEEYLLRHKTVEQVCLLSKITLHSGKYDPQDWLEVSQAYKDDPEGGRRCALCYKMRLRETFQLAQNLGCDLFTTTITISPHKDSNTIIAIGKSIDVAHFFPIDFKKENGFLHTMQLAKQHQLYRQHYCGCVYSNIGR